MVRFKILLLISLIASLTSCTFQEDLSQEAETEMEEISESNLVVNEDKINFTFLQAGLFRSFGMRFNSFSDNAFFSENGDLSVLVIKENLIQDGDSFLRAARNLSEKEIILFSESLGRSEHADFIQSGLDHRIEAELVLNGSFLTESFIMVRNDSSNRVFVERVSNGHYFYCSPEIIIRVLVEDIDNKFNYRRYYGGSEILENIQRESTRKKDSALNGYPLNYVESELSKICGVERQSFENNFNLIEKYSLSLTENINLSKSSFEPKFQVMPYEESLLSELNLTLSYFGFEEEQPILISGNSRINIKNTGNFTRLPTLYFKSSVDKNFTTRVIPSEGFFANRGVPPNEIGTYILENQGHGILKVTCSFKTCNYEAYVRG